MKGIRNLNIQGSRRTFHTGKCLRSLKNLLWLEFKLLKKHIFKNLSAKPFEILLRRAKSNPFMELQQIPNPGEKMKLLSILILTVLVSCGNSKSSGKRAPEKNTQPATAELTGVWESACIEEAPKRQITAEFKANGDVVKTTKFFGKEEGCEKSNVNLSVPATYRYVVGKTIEGNVVELDLTKEDGEREFHSLQVNSDSIIFATGRAVSFNEVEKLTKK